MPKISQLPQDMPILNQALRDLQTAQGDIATLQSDVPGFVTYNPQITALTGAFTTASATGRYALINKLVFLEVFFIITTVGTGAFPLISLPVASNGTGYIIPGSEVLNTGAAVMAQLPFGGNVMVVRNYNGTNPAASASRFLLTGFYEAA